MLHYQTVHKSIAFMTRVTSLLCKNEDPCLHFGQKLEYMEISLKFLCSEINQFRVMTSLKLEQGW